MAGPIARRAFFWLMIVAGVLWLGTFLAAWNGNGLNLVAHFEPATGKALSGDELAALHARLGVGFVVTELISWMRESTFGSFGWKPPAFLVLTMVGLVGWLRARTKARGRGAAPQPGLGQGPTV